MCRVYTQEVLNSKLHRQIQYLGCVYGVHDVCVTDVCVCVYVWRRCWYSTAVTVNIYQHMLGVIISIKRRKNIHLQTLTFNGLAAGAAV